MKRFTNAMSGAVLAGAIATTAFSGQASAQPVGGTERFTIISTSENGGKVIATGAFTAVGTDVEQPSDGPTTHSTFVFPNGTIAVSRTDDPGVEGDFNPTACVGHFANTGTYVFTGGTGAYAGITGGGTYSSAGTLIAGRSPSGCTDVPIALIGVGRAQGPVAFS